MAHDLTGPGPLARRIVYADLTVAGQRIRTSGLEADYLRLSRMHVSESHRMKCSEMLAAAGQVGRSGRDLLVAENQTIYTDPNDDPTAANISLHFIRCDSDTCILDNRR